MNYIADDAQIHGNVEIGENVSIWFHVTIRAEKDKIIIGDSSNIQDNCVMHCDEGAPVIIGSGVTVGHGSIIHGCKIGDNSLIGMGSIIMDNAVIGKNCIIGAGSLVVGGTEIPDNSVALGAPAKLLRQIKQEEIESNKKSAIGYVREGKEYFGV